MLSNPLKYSASTCPHCGECIKEEQGEKEPVKVITVRMPLSLHRALTDSSHGARQSMNEFCVDAIKIATAPAQ